MFSLFQMPSKKVRGILKKPNSGRSTGKTVRFSQRFDDNDHPRLAKTRKRSTTRTATILARQQTAPPLAPSNRPKSALLSAELNRLKIK